MKRDLMYRIKDVFNLNKNIPIKSDLTNITSLTTKYRYKQNISDWMLAIQSAESVDNPNRRYLLDIYKTIELDAKVTGKTQNRVNKTILQDFKVIKNKETDEDLTIKLQSKWFSDFMKYVIESKFYGFSVIQFGDIVDSEFVDVKLVDRYHVIPEKKEIKRGVYDQSGISIDSSQYSDWVMFVGDTHELGLLHKVSQYALYKKEAVALYNEFVELYGSPTRIAKIGPNTNQETIANMLKYMGSNAYGIFDKDTEIEFTESAAESYDNIFQRLIDWNDEQISILISGETMTSDSGSSYAQSLVHKKTADATSYMDNLYIQNVVNTQLIPFMVNLGMTEFADCKFEFFYNEQSNLQEQFIIDSKLLEHFDIDEDYLINKYGTKIISKKEEDTTLPLNYKEIKNKYNK